MKKLLILIMLPALMSVTSFAQTFTAKDKADLAAATIDIFYLKSNLVRPDSINAKLARLDSLMIALKVKVDAGGTILQSRTTSLTSADSVIIKAAVAQAISEGRRMFTNSWDYKLLKNAQALKDSAQDIAIQKAYDGSINADKNIKSIGQKVDENFTITSADIKRILDFINALKIPFANF